MKKICFMILGMILLTTSLNLQAQTPGEGFDVTHYNVNLWGFDFTDHTLQGEASITFTATATTNTFVLELKSLTVNTVESTFSSVCNFSQEGDLLIITTGESIAAGQVGSLTVSYGGSTFSETWGGVEWWGQYVYNLGVGFDSQPHNLGKTWFPCVDNFTDKATYYLCVVVPNDKKAICGGNHINTFDNGDGTSTWHWEIPQEVATYHVSFAIGDYMEWTDTYNGIERDIPIEVYVKPSQIGSVPGTFVHIKEIASFFEENFGPYPFNRIGYVCTGKGCMEHIDNIAITSGVIAGNTTQEEYLAHELSHMYFGNKTTCSTAGDMWLNEGFAQFCGMFYRVGFYGEDNYQAEMASTINTITNWCKTESNWIPLNNMPEDMTYDDKAVYNRGAVIVNTMMNYMGRENFLSGLRHYLNTYAYSAASSEQLRDALTEATGIDMNGFFDTYVFTGGMPHYSVNLLDVDQNGTQYDAKIRLNYWHVGPSHVGQNNGVEVTFINNAGQLQTVLVNWDGLESEQIITLDIEPIAAFADYYNHFLDAKLDKNLTATANASISVERLKASASNVTDSVMLRIEGHLVGPDNDPGIPGLTLSTRHYWNVMRLDLGEAEVSGQIQYHYTNAVDGDIIQTENDSAVLLYRANALDAWHSIPYTQTGTWKAGVFIVSDLQTGQYTIGAIDKTLWGINENNAPSPQVYPNPTNGLLHIIGLPQNVGLPQCDSPTGQTKYRITSLTGQIMMTGTLNNKETIDVSTLPAGAYFLIINDKTQKFIIQ